MFKNWKNVCALIGKDRLTGNAVALCDPESEIGKKLAGAFPECFSQTEISGPVPKSTIMHVAKGMEIVNHEDPGCYTDDWWTFVFGREHDKIPIPVVGVYREDREYGGTTGEILDQNDMNEIVSQLVGQRPLAGTPVTWRGKKCIIVNITASVNSTETFTSNEKIRILELCPAECIDLEH